MNKTLTTLFLAALAMLFTPGAAEAGRYSHCEAVGDYVPPRGAVRMFTCRVRTEWEQRYHCLPCGRKLPYQVKVITYRERYTDGTVRTWKCVVAGSEMSLGK